VKKKNLSIEITKNDLCSEQKAEMWNIYKQYYQLDKDAFMDRFNDSNYYALYKVGDELVGFTGLKIHEAKIQRKKVLLIWCGHAAVLKAQRGKRWFTRMGFILVAKYWKPLLLGRIWFWTGALSYRSYLIFARSMQEYYPNVNNAMPSLAQCVRDHIGAYYYGDHYFPTTGTVKRNSKTVIDQSVSIKKQDLSNPQIAFYNKVNPLWSKGHGLITFAPITIKNMLLVALRGMQKRRKQRLALA